MNKPKLIYIEWADAVSQAAWKDDREAEEWGKNCTWHVHQVGWVLKETDKYIHIASQSCEEDEYRDRLWGHHQKIPKTWIIKRKNIKL